MRFFMALVVAFAFAPMVSAQTTDHKETLNINVTTPGTLADLILQQTENLTDVVTLHLSGTINDADLITLQQRLTRMRHLDAQQLQLTEIPTRFLYNNDTLRTVILPALTTTVGGYAFNGCDSLKSINFPSTLKVIGDYAFQYCSLTKALLPEGLEILGAGAFYGCSSLHEVNIPSTLKVIPESAFSNTYELKSLTIPEGVTEIGKNAFYYAFWENKQNSGHKRIHLTMPSTLKRIESNAFASNGNIVEVKLNEGLEYMESSCFGFLPIKEVTIPSTVYHARYAFYGCDSLTRITCLPLVPPANQGVNLIKDNNEEVKGCTLIVPAASINVYKQTLGYDHFAVYEAIDYMPTQVTIGRDVSLTTPANVSPINITIMRDMSNGYYGFDGMGTLRIEGSNTLNVGRLSMFYAFNEGDYYYKYWYDTSVDNPWGTNPEVDRNYKKAFTSIIANAPWTANQAEQTINLTEDKWMFVCLPFDVKVSDIEVLDELGGHFVVYEYDSQQRAAANMSNTWRQLSAGNTMQAGHGYIIQGKAYYKSEYNNDIYSKGASMRFPSKAGGSMGTLSATDDVTIPLTDYPAEFAHNRGWNLVGNPYPCYVNGANVDFTAPVIIWNPYYSRYEAIRLTDDAYIFSPLEAFFVQYRTEAPEIVFHKEGRQLSLAIEGRALQAQRRASASSCRKVFNVLLSNGNDSDRTRFVINPDAKTDYEADKDAAYMSSLSNNVSCIYTYQGGIKYAINERPLADGLINLGLRLAADATYTLTLSTKEAEEVTLIDRQEGTAIQLTAQGYTFYAKAGTLDNRFAIQLGEMTNINNVNDNDNVNKNVTYDLQGRRVQRSMMKKGVFIQNGKKVVMK